MNQEITSWLPLIVALTTGWFALTQIRSNNITNARIRWLDNLRLHLTDFLAESNMLQLKLGLQIANDHSSKQGYDIPEATIEYMNKINQSLIEHLGAIESKCDLIKLNLNPSEDLHQIFDSRIDQYLVLFNSLAKVKVKSEYMLLLRELTKESEKLILLARYILKLDWEKTKRSYISRKVYMKYGEGSQILLKAKQLSFA